MADKSDRHNLVSDVLLRKYELLRQELWLHIGFFKGHVTKFQLVGTALLAVGAYVLANKELRPGVENWWVWWLGINIIPIFCSYLAFDLIESQYAIILIDERLATIEDDINSQLGRRVLIWETAVSPLFWQKFRPIPGVINPDWFLGAFGGAFVVFYTFVVPILLYYTLWLVPQLSLLRRAAVLIGVTVAVASVVAIVFCARHVLVGMRGKPRIAMREMIEKLE